MNAFHSPLRIGRRLSMTAVLCLGSAACGGDRSPDTEEIASMSEDEAAEMAGEMKDLSGVEACKLLTASEVEALLSGDPTMWRDLARRIPPRLQRCSLKTRE